MKARNQFMCRPTSYLIGSTDFFRDNTVGILELSYQDQLEDEVPSPRTPSPNHEEVPSVSQNTEPSIAASTVPYPIPYYPPADVSFTLVSIQYVHALHQCTGLSDSF